MRRPLQLLAVLAFGCDRASTPETFAETYARAWCDCAERDLPEAVADVGDLDDCVESVRAVGAWAGWYDRCDFDVEAARACVPELRRADGCVQDGLELTSGGVPLTSVSPCGDVFDCPVPAP